MNRAKYIGNTYSPQQTVNIVNSSILVVFIDDSEFHNAVRLGSILLYKDMKLSLDLAG
jgi:hypothetical protein